MGKKSRQKKLKRQQPTSISQERIDSNPFLTKIIFYIICVIPFSALFVDSRFFFPYVGPKSLFLMAGVEIAFFLWLFLIIKYEHYRPKLNFVSGAFLFYLFVLILSTIFGVDPSRSFWSKFERMTGLLMWIHIFALFLIVSSVFKTQRSWEKFFIWPVIVGSLVALSSFSGEVSSRGGGTLGNSSFLGTFLLFCSFFALWLFFRQKQIWQKLLLTASFIFMSVVVYLREARAAFLAIGVGLVLILLMFGAFGLQKRFLKILARVFLVVFLVAGWVGVLLLLKDGSVVQEKFVELTNRGRVVNWQISQMAFTQRPLLGWGLENYTLVFNRYFNPCLFTSECGGEIWFDRAHNIIFDILVTTGLVGLFGYFLLLASAVTALAKGFFSQKIDFWSFAIFTALIVGYFLQNLTVFDMPTSLMMLSFVLGYTSFLAGTSDSSKTRKIVIFTPKDLKIGMAIFVVFLITFFNFVVKPFVLDRDVIKSLVADNFEERMNLYKKVFSISPLGQYQIREYLAKHSQANINLNININIDEIKKDPAFREKAIEEFDFLTKKLEELLQKSPLDYRIILRLAQLYQDYYLLSPDKISEAEKYAKMAMFSSPFNQQSYWVFAQLMFFKGKFQQGLEYLQRAIDLEPNYLNSYKIALTAARALQFSEVEEKIIEKVKKLHPEWEKELKNYQN